MGFPVVPLHQAHGPLPKVHWRPLGCLNERVSVLCNVSYCHASVLSAVTRT